MKDKAFMGYLIKFVLLSSQLLYYSLRVSSDCSIQHESDAEKLLMKRLEPLKGQHFETTVTTENKEKYSYYLGICTEPKLPAGQPVISKAGMVQIREPSKLKVVGYYNETQLLGGDGWILLKYKGGDPYLNHCLDQKNLTHQDRQALIMITCGPKLRSDLQVIEENKDIEEDCYYLFQLQSSVACTPQDGLSAGSIFCIILLTAVGLYLLIGFLHQRIVVGAKGLEQIPNFSLWKEFGKLQADGCDFLCRCGERQEAKMYRGIDDQLLNPEARDERDDRLLPM